MKKIIIEEGVNNGFFNETLLTDGESSDNFITFKDN